MTEIKKDNGRLLTCGALSVVAAGAACLGGSVITVEMLRRGIGRVEGLVTPSVRTLTPEMLATLTPVAQLPRATDVLPMATAPVRLRPTETRTPIRPASAISCEFVQDENLSRRVVFEGFPVRAIQVLTTDTAQQKNFFKAADWNSNAALNLGFAEPGGLTNQSKIRMVDSTPYYIQTELQGWTKVFLQEGTLSWMDKDGRTRKVALPEKQGRTFGVYIREKYDTNGNTPITVKLDCNVALHGQTQHVDRPNSAFVSEGQLGQESVSVFTGKNFDGKDFTIPNDNTANDEFTVVVVDTNTGAYTVATQKGKGMPFELEQQNWK